MIRRSTAVAALAATLALGACSDVSAPAPDRTLLAATPDVLPRTQPEAVEGEGVHYFSTAVVHSREPTGTGFVQRSTEIIRLTGDLDGFILYHPTTTVDTEAGTLVNTGTQIFSGTVLGSGPLVLHDDRFRFAVDLATGATTGSAYLGRSLDAPHRGAWAECELDIVGTGQTPEGDGLARYSGTCRRIGRR